MFGEEFDKDPVLRIVVDIPHKTPIHFTKILSEEVNQLLQLLWVLGLFILIVHSSGNCHTFVLVPGRCTYKKGNKCKSYKNSTLMTKH